MYIVGSTINNKHDEIDGNTILYWSLAVALEERASALKSSKRHFLTCLSK